MCAEIDEDCGFGILKIENDPQIIFDAEAPILLEFAGKLMGSERFVERIVHKCFEFCSELEFTLRTDRDLSLVGPFER